MVERVRVIAIVRGRVQGVGYRMFAVERGRELDLDGYARNLPDGRAVEVVAEGPRAALEQLVVVLRHGPTAARVDGVDVSWGPAMDTFTSFDVRVH